MSGNLFSDLWHFKGNYLWNILKGLCVNTHRRPAGSPLSFFTSTFLSQGALQKKDTFAVMNVFLYNLTKLHIIKCQKLPYMSFVVLIILTDSSAKLVCKENKSGWISDRIWILYHCSILSGWSSCCLVIICYNLLM